MSGASFAARRSPWMMLWVATAVCMACGSGTSAADPPLPNIVLDGPFVAIPRALSTEAHQQLREALGQASSALTNDASDTFYIALRRMEWDGTLSAVRDACPWEEEAQGLAASMASGLPELTPKEKVEHFFTAVVLHEVGHTLGLRHNFKGSFGLPAFSVMDYHLALDQPYRDTPGPYDVEAIRYLYGLSDTLPQEPFCTDEDASRDPDCNRFDATPDPLTLFYGANYHTALAVALKQGESLPSDSALNSVLQYLRASKQSSVRLQAWNIAMEGLKAPLSADALASSPTYAATADAMSRRIFQRLYLDSTGQRGSFSADPPATDSALTQAILEQLRANLLNLDGVRSPATRRVTGDVLKKLQRYDAYATLLEAREALAASIPGLSGEELLAAEDLAARIDRATSPYFN